MRATAGSRAGPGCGQRARRVALLAGLAAAALLASGLAAASGLTVRDDRGTEHRLEAPAGRIVSMLPSLTEIVAALGAQGRLVGVDRWSNWPPAVERLPRTGDLEAVAIETVVALRPDVVLASTSSRGLDRLESLGLRVVRLRSDTHADVERALKLVAQLIGDPAAGTAAWVRIQGELEHAAAQVPPAWRGRRVYLEIGTGPYAAGASSFIGETLARLGLVNIVGPELGAFPRLNPEFVLQASPDLVMGPRREVDAMASRPGWRSLAALQAGRRCALDPADYEQMIRPGPRLGETAERLARCIAQLAPPSAGPAGGVR